MSPAVIDHLDLVVTDLDRSRSFYATVLAPLGWCQWALIAGERREPVHYFGGMPPKPTKPRNDGLGSVR